MSMSNSRFRIQLNILIYDQFNRVEMSYLSRVKNAFQIRTIRLD